MPHLPLEIVGCPECTAAAEVVDRLVVKSAEGPAEYTVVMCVRGHGFSTIVERPASPTHRRQETIHDASAPRE
jgi:hypothetical protein